MRRGVLVVAVLVAVALALVCVCARTGGQPRSAAAESPTMASSDPVVLGGVGTSSGALSGARATGERFLRGYLRFLYGRASASAIDGAGAALRLRLRRGRLRVPPSRAQRTPRIAGIDVQRLSTTTVRVTAVVADGDIAPYRTSALVQRRANRWTVVRLARP